MGPVVESGYLSRGSETALPEYFLVDRYGVLNIEGLFSTSWSIRRAKIVCYSVVVPLGTDVQHRFRGFSDETNGVSEQIGLYARR